MAFYPNPPRKLSGNYRKLADFLRVCVMWELKKRMGSTREKEPTLWGERVGTEHYNTSPVLQRQHSFCAVGSPTRSSGLAAARGRATMSLRTELTVELKQLS